MLIKNKLKRIYKFSGIFSVFFIITLLLSILIGNLVSIKQNLDKSNEFFSENKKKIAINLPLKNNITWKDEFFKIISQSQEVILGTSLGFTDDIESNLVVKPIYFNKDTYKSPPIKEGRFLGTKDCESSQGTAVIGENYMSFIESKNGQEYIEFNKKKYKVVGVLGDSKGNSLYDNWMIINLNAYMNENKLSNSYTIDCINGNLNQELMKITKALKSIDKNASINILPDYINNGDTLSFALYSSKSLIMMATMMGVLLFLNIINSSYLWVDEMKKEMAVRKVYGATNRNIMFKIIIMYVTTALIAAALAIVFQNMITKSGITLWNANMINSNREANMVIILGVIIGSIIIGVIAAMIPSSIVLKLQPSHMLRGK